MSHMMNARILFSSSSEIKHYIYQFTLDAPFNVPFHRNYFFEIKLYQEKFLDKQIYVGKARDKNLNIETKWIKLTENLDDSLSIMKKIIRRELGYAENNDEYEAIKREKEAVLEKIKEYQAKEEYFSDYLPFVEEGFVDSLIDKSEIIERKELVHGLKCGTGLFYYDVVSGTVNTCSDIAQEINNIKYSNFDRNLQKSLRPYLKEAEELNRDFWKDYMVSNPDDI